ncbi:MAG: hypothetical protein PHG74_12495 [Kiritimatiellae bacterium]|jgi:hypothetical protein|nr:hypothetical protein [Kiritimatiellia bacterium]
MKHETQKGKNDNKMRLFATLLLLLLVSGCSKSEVACEGELCSKPKLYVMTNAAPIVVVSESSPDPYTHPTTHPKAQFDELNLDPELGHGDGGTEVLFMGKIVHIAKEGEIVPVPLARFFKLNDDMLLGEKLKNVLPFTTDTNGNFNAIINVFAAYGCKKGSFTMDVPEPRESDFGKDSTAYQKARYNFQMKAFEKAHKDGEWIAYQTGTSIIGVEADGFEPLRVNVRYQQPSTLIILKKKTGE